ncbi:hypothetical protein EDB19DRAFT_1998062 [Suillus lakei]|nr:hypothetical protein EDB19DRAFT_1998062 [Suillus lakei]
MLTNAAHSAYSLVLVHAQVEGLRITDTATYSKLKEGDSDLLRDPQHEHKPLCSQAKKTTLTLEDDIFSFSPPVAGTAGCLTAEHKTGVIRDLGFSLRPLFSSRFPTSLDYSTARLVPGKCVPQPVLWFKEVEDGNQAIVLWNLVLRVYITSTHKKNSVFVGAIDPPAIWMHDLHALPENTTLSLAWDTADGHYMLTQASWGTAKSVCP